MKAVLSALKLAVLATAVAAQGHFNPSTFPPVNAVPSINSPEVKGWLSGISFADVPVFPIHTGNPPACPALEDIPANQCWWTCQSCPADDIEACPTPGTWGLTFDDGPTINTPSLLRTLKSYNIKATFFVTGSNVIRNAEILKQEVAGGHHIASHTWSHYPLTTLTNEQIVAELKWTEKAVMDITGLRLKYMRPPYGDIDNRVRAVIKKLGYIVVDWTNDNYDSKDYALNNGYTEATLSAAVTNMSNTLKAYGTNPGSKGVITLQHDLYPVTVEFARRLAPVGAKGKLSVMSVAECLNDTRPYQGHGSDNGGKSAGTGRSEANSMVAPNGTIGAFRRRGGMMATLALSGILAIF